MKIIIGITGASGAIYAESLIIKLNQLYKQIHECAVIISDNGKAVWEFELQNNNYKSLIPQLKFKCSNPSVNDMFAAPASGSAGFDSMIVCPCSMGTLGKIANGTSDNLIIRAADVILKERKKLILVTREMPLSLIHINNMKLITQAGAIICPASPSFYSKPNNISDLTDTVIDRVLSLAGFTFKHYQWNKTID